MVADLKVLEIYSGIGGMHYALKCNSNKFFFLYKLLNFTSAPKIFKENIVDNFLASSIIQLRQKESLFIPDNSMSLRNRVIIITSNEKVSIYAFKTFTYCSNVFLKCFNLDFFNLKFSSFIT